MDDKKFIAFFFELMLREHFGTKSKMARELNLQLRTLQMNFQKLDRAKGGNLAFERLVIYCCEHDIDIQQMYNRFIGKVDVGRRTTVLRETNRMDSPCFLFDAKSFPALQKGVFQHSIQCLIGHLYCETFGNCQRYADYIFPRMLDDVKVECGIIRMLHRIDRIIHDSIHEAQ